MNAVDYLPVLVAFLAAVIAIFGKPKIAEAKKGIRRLTLTGHFALLLAVCALIASVIVTWRSQEAAKTREKQVAEIRRVAHADLRFAIGSIVKPFFMAFGQLPGAKPADPWDSLVPNLALDSNARVKVSSIRLAATCPFRRLPFIGETDQSWEKIIQDSTDEGIQGIDRVLAMYGPYLNAEELALIDDFRHCDFLLMWLKRLGGAQKPDNLQFVIPADVEQEQRGFFRPYGYEEFWQTVERLDKVLDKTRAAEKKRFYPE